MKWMIFLFLLCAFLPLGAQLRTRYRPLPLVRPAVKRKVWGLAGSRWAIRVEFARIVC